SRLSHLKEFPIHKIKIDQSFIKDIPNSKKDSGIVKAIVDMANHLELSTVAEGVETKEQFEFLKEIGCKEIQGYLIGKPLKASEVLSFVSHFHSQLVGK
ncbi:MAG: EAL domain-containing protein, partial [Leptospiraceae bacterium]|nr:EAL domain-containing protein [Leptospiraceae bacterium]